MTIAEMADEFKSKNKPPPGAMMPAVLKQARNTRHFHR